MLLFLQRPLVLWESSWVSTVLLNVYNAAWRFNATFNNISVISCNHSVLLVEETVVPGENHRPVKSQR
jgi:hypothetical protein